MVFEENIEQPVLVTGGCGFIGKRVVKKLLDKDIKVRVLAVPNEEIPADWNGKVEIARGFLPDEKTVKEAVNGVRTIIHLAAIVSDWGDEDFFWKITVEGSRKIFDEALANDAKVVLASSIVVYGEQIGKIECDEKTSYGKTFGPYSRTKKEQEKLAVKYHNEKGMKLSIVRPANVYGPGAGTWLHDVIDVLKSKAGGLVSGGSMNAGLAYVDNVADILILAGAQENESLRIYIACDCSEITWKKYFTDIAEIIGEKQPKAVPYFAAYLGAIISEKIWKLFKIKKRPPITMEALNLIGSDNRFSIDNVKRDLGYVPRVSYSEGLSRTIDYLKEKGIVKI
jgi:nucleoside-diphosphate-sugar epimerase